ncbi:isatin hydrolase-like [Patiria miniata]|uniref:Cyclase n=1 Tax=Patiria miniata TaxID=46514 RepID=A0A913ZSV1_PATMI|nr:isatin hydrolase-like [Patiria miniata]
MIGFDLISELNDVRTTVDYRLKATPPATDMSLRAQVLVSVLILHVMMTSALDKGEILDMSYPFGESTLYWPGEASFELDIRVRGPSGVLPWYEANAFSSPEHGGTHIDAPSHFSEGKQRVDDIPVNKLVGPAIRIDITDKAKANRDYEMTSQDLHDWEAAHGEIPVDSLLFVYTGWGAFYPDRLAYFGSARNDTYLNERNESVLHFPGVAPEAASWLVGNRKIAGLGIDTPSIDYGQSTQFMTHQILLGANIYGLENVANVDKLPNTGATVYSLPITIEDGSGAPARIIAVLDEDGEGSVTASPPKSLLVTLLGFALFVVDF